jgi:hypothetical protein
VTLGQEWRKSTRSGDNGNCVEARQRNGAVQMRDSKNADGPVLSFTPDGWDAFLSGVRHGEFDLR